MTSKKRNISFVAIFSFAIHLSIAQVTQFQITYGTQYNDAVGRTNPTSDGGYILMMDDISNPSLRDMVVAKLDSIGNILWCKKFGESNTDDVVVNVIEAHNGGYLIFGYLDYANTPIGIGIRVDNAGNILWVKRNLFSFEAEQTIDGGYVNPGDGASIIKIDSSGNYQWSKLYNHFFGSQSFGRRTFDGGYIILGTTIQYASGGSGDYDIIASKIDSAGNLLWTKVYGTPLKIEEALAVALSTDGGFVFLCGAISQTQSIFDFMIVKTDAMGNVVWSKLYGGNLFEAAYDIESALGGIGYLVIGHTEGFEGPLQYGFRSFLMRTDISGSPLWTEMYGAMQTNPSTYDQTYQLYTLNDGGYFMAGATNSFGAGGWDAWCIKTNSSGLSGCNEVPNNPTVSTPVLTVSSPTGIVTVANYTSSPYTVSTSNFQLTKTVLCLNGSITGVTNENETVSIEVFPNPSSSIFTLKKPSSSPATIEVVSVLGNTVIKTTIQGETSTIDLTKEARGVYFIKVTEGSEFYIQKIILE
jgi:hypothetical protein